VDFQVQIRGYRVEPGEVEAALARIEGVREAVVLVRGEGREQRLVAYLARELGPAGEALEVEGVRRALRAELPAYTVPDGFLLLDRLPLTPNAKVDRRALRKMKEEAASAEGYRAPETALERSLVELMKELLELERVGVEDNFFDLGANSLLLVRFHGRLQELLGREIQAVELFNHPTVRSLAAHLTRTEEVAQPSSRRVDDRGDQLKTGRNRLRRLKGRRRG
jgi:acyl carrier protein